MEIDDTNRQVEKATSRIFTRALDELNNSTGNARAEVRTALLKAARNVNGIAWQAHSRFARCTAQLFAGSKMAQFHVRK